MSKIRAGDTLVLKQASLAFNVSQTPDLFRKAVPAIHIAPKAGSISLQQRKMFSSLIKNAIRQDLEQPGRRTFEITIGALSHDVELNSRNTDYVKSTINSLMSTVVNWDYLTQDKRSIWKASGLLASAELERSVLRYTFSDQIRGELLNPEIYALIDMRITRQFRKAHSLALWENIVRYEAIGMSAKFPLATFRELILGQDTSAQSYKEYKLLKSRVLVPCLREVNTISDHIFELVEHKLGRQVLALQFRVTRKPEGPGGLAKAPENALVAEVIRFNVLRSEAAQLLAKYGEDKVQGAIAYTSARLVQKGVAPLTNPAAYFRKTLQQGYAPAESMKVPVAMSPETKRVSQGEVKERYISTRVTDASAYFSELEIDDQTLLIERYNDMAPLEKLRISVSKASKTAFMSFYRWLALDIWGEPTADDLLEFVLSGQKLSDRL